MRSLPPCGGGIGRGGLSVLCCVSLLVTRFIRAPSQRILLDQSVHYSVWRFRRPPFLSLPGKGGREPPNNELSEISDSRGTRINILL
jgi:hypothetical protein